MTNCLRLLPLLCLCLIAGCEDFHTRPGPWQFPTGQRVDAPVAGPDISDWKMVGVLRVLGNGSDNSSVLTAARVEMQSPRIFMFRLAPVKVLTISELSLQVGVREDWSQTPSEFLRDLGVPVGAKSIVSIKAHGFEIRVGGASAANGCSLVAGEARLRAQQQGVQNWDLTGNVKLSGAANTFSVSQARVVLAHDAAEIQARDGRVLARIVAGRCELFG